MFAYCKAENHIHLFNFSFICLEIVLFILKFKKLFFLIGG